MVVIIRCLLCIHGLLSSSKDFSFLVPNLSKYYDGIYSYDMPGHGENELKFNTNEIKKFYIRKYDELALKYDVIDILGYSLGGVIASYIQNFRRVNKLILISPAYRYLNLKNYNYTKKEKKNCKIGQIFPKRNIMYLFKFQKIVFDLSFDIKYIYPKTLIIWGNEDYLVKESSGKELYDKVINKDKRYIILNNHNHFNIVYSKEVLQIIQDFVV